MTSPKPINRRDVLGLAGAVAALGAGLGVLAGSGNVSAQEAGKPSEKQLPAQMFVKIYKPGADKPFYSTQLPEDVAGQILSMGAGGKNVETAEGKISTVQIKIERSNAVMQGKFELIGESMIKLGTVTPPAITR